MDHHALDASIQRGSGGSGRRRIRKGRRRKRDVHPSRKAGRTGPQNGVQPSVSYLRKIQGESPGRPSVRTHLPLRATKRGFQKRKGLPDLSEHYIDVENKIQIG